MMKLQGPSNGTRPARSLDPAERRKAAGLLLLIVAAAIAETLPTSLPTFTTSILAGNEEYTGTIPSQLGLLSRLTAFEVHNNELTGTVPSEIGCWTALREDFIVRSNALTGRVPSQIGRLTRLTRDVHLDFNSFSGLFPSQIGALTRITRFLTLNHNSFTGTIATEVGQLVRLETNLNLNTNQLSGTIATQIGQLVSLTSILGFAANQLTGPVASELGLLVDMTEDFLLKSNELCNDLPTEVQALSSQMTSGWQLATSNDLGTPCCETLPGTFSCAPTRAPTLHPTLSWPPTPAPTPFCQRGEFLDGSACQPCEAGKYRNTTGAPAVCTTCPAGTYRGYSPDPSDAHVCTDCPAGRLSASDHTECTECSAGEYALNDTSCESCEAGKYAPTAQEDECLTCSAGFATGAALAATSCESCEAGTFAAAGSVNCSTCPAGTTSSNRAEACTNCSAGFYSDADGASSCTACAAGSFARHEQATGCTMCTAGTHQPATGQSTCDDCQAGYFSDTNGSSLCLKCSSEFGSSYTSRDGDASCDLCITGYYMSDDGKCASCPDGAVCDEAGATLAGLELEQGHYRFEPTSTEVYKCPYHSHCLGGNVTRDALCKSGTMGALCGSCMSGWYFDAFEEACAKCDIRTGGLIARITAFALLVAGAVLMSMRPVRDRLSGQAATFYTKHRDRLSDTSELMTAVLVTMQVIVLLQKNHLQMHSKHHEEENHTPYDEVLESCDFLALDVVRTLPISCFGREICHLHYVLAWFFLPLVVLVVGALALRHAPREDRCAHLGVFVMGLHLILPAMSATFSESFRCTDFDGGDLGELSYLSVDPHIKCSSQRYRAIVAVGALACFVYPVGVPLALLAWLVKFRHRLDPPGLPEAEAVEQRRRDTRLTEDCAVAWFALRHKPRYWFFEVYNTTRRLLLTCGAKVFGTADSMLLYLLFVAISTTVLERELQSNLNPFMNAFAYCCSWQIVLTIIGMIAVHSDMTEESGSIIIGLVLLFSNLAIIGGVVLGTQYDVTEKRRRTTLVSSFRLRPSWRPTLGRNSWRPSNPVDTVTEDGNPLHEPPTTEERATEMGPVSLVLNEPAPASEENPKLELATMDPSHDKF